MTNTPPTPNTGSPADGVMIPPGMTPWHGGDSAPADWDGGPVLRWHGGMSIPGGQFAWISNGGNLGAIRAYTPRAPAERAPMASQAEDAIHAGRAVLAGEGDGTYDEACNAIRQLLAAFHPPATPQGSPEPTDLERVPLGALHDLQHSEETVVPPVGGASIIAWAVLEIDRLRTIARLSATPQGSVSGGEQSVVDHPLSTKPVVYSEPGLCYTQTDTPPDAGAIAAAAMREAAAKLADDLASECIRSAEGSEHEDHRRDWLARSWGAGTLVHRIRVLPLDQPAGFRVVPVVPTEAMVERVAQSGQFLIDRLFDHEHGMTSDENAREWHGHVTPAVARFLIDLAALAAAPAQSQGQG